jgi:RNA polymerase sigma-70 factor (ECF subfamily)
MNTYAYQSKTARVLPTTGFLLPGFSLIARPLKTQEPVLTETSELMERIVARDEKALDLLYERFSSALYAVILRIVKSREDADEILCEIFMQVWNKASSYDLARGATYTWLVSMARNRAIDRIRSKGYKNSKQNGDDPSELDMLENLSSESPLETILLSERASVVREALRGISQEQRTVLEIAYFEGYTQSQIAERLALPLGTVKTRMRDGMKALQALLRGRIEWP